MKNTKIIRLEEKKDTLVNYLKKILDMAEKGEIENILIASFLKREISEAEIVDDCLVHETLTGYYKLCDLEKQYLISALQIDLNYNIVKANIDDLIEIINE